MVEVIQADTDCILTAEFKDGVVSINIQITGMPVRAMDTLRENLKDYLSPITDLIMKASGSVGKNKEDIIEDLTPPKILQ